MRDDARFRHECMQRGGARLRFDQAKISTTETTERTE